MTDAEAHKPSGDEPPSKPRTVKGDLTCIGCGEPLAGMKYGGRCPRCSMPIARSADPQKTHDGPVGDQFLQINFAARRRFALGCWVAVLAILAMIAVRTAVVADPDLDAARIGAYLLLSLIWLNATMLLTPAWQDERGPTVATGRQWIRIGAAALVLYPLGSLLFGADGILVELDGAPGTIMHIILTLARVVGFASIIGLAFLLSEVAMDAELERPGRALMGAVWSLPITALLVQMTPVTAEFYEYPLIFLLLIFWYLSLLLLLYGLIAMANYALATIRYAHDQAYREVERAEQPPRHATPKPAAAQDQNQNQDQPRDTPEVAPTPKHTHDTDGDEHTESKPDIPLE